jgi:DNA-binding transcriptional LysR family regulator
MLSAPPILDGELLAAFATYLNFTRAAREVALSQPALFERVQRLAEAAGGALYSRRGRDLALTKRGRELAAFARESLSRSQDFARALRNEEPRGEVTLAAGEGAYLYLLGPAIQAIPEGTTLLPLTRGAAGAAESVLSGEAELGVAATDLVPLGLVAEEIVRTPLCAALPERHPLAKRKTLTVAKLADERWVLSPEGQLHATFSGEPWRGSACRCATRWKRMAGR